MCNGISGYMWFLGTQLYFKDATCIFQGCFWFPASLPRLTAPWLTGNFSISIFSRHFFSSVFFPFKPGNTYGCSHHRVKLNLVEITSVCMCTCSCLYIRVHPHIRQDREQSSGTGLSPDRPVACLYKSS